MLPPNIYNRTYITALYARQLKPQRIHQHKTTGITIPFLFIIIIIYLLIYLLINQYSFFLALFV